MLNNTTEPDYRALEAARHQSRELQIELLKQAKVLVQAFQENQDGLGLYRSHIEPLLMELEQVLCHDDTFRMLDHSLDGTIRLARDFLQTEPMRPPWED